MKQLNLACRIYLVRHGQTQWNLEQRFQGLIDVPLDQDGKNQAHQLACELKDISFDKIYASPLLRAKETATILNQYLNKEIHFEPNLREGAFGKAEGMTRAEYLQYYSVQHAQVHAMPFLERIQSTVVPGSESIAEIADRVISFLNTLVQQHVGETLLVVSHGFVIRSVLASLCEMDDREISIENTGYIVLEHQGGKFELKHQKGLIKKLACP